MKQYATADPHLGHANIIRYCKRPFKNVKEMNEKIIKNFNDILKEDDVLYCVGDYCFRNSPGGKEGEGSPDKAIDYIKKFKGLWVFSG